MKSAAIRSAFLAYFERKNHQILQSSSLVPVNDPTLLFTNAGMVQFKESFLGEKKPSYARVATSQRCVRAGGKHNDLENVGHTARHHTFFEMLGNFSFGDYFKKEAIFFAWEFLTVELGLPAEKLWVTVYHDDDEAAAIWREHIGVAAHRIIRCGEKDNFWSMGETGPCGPCTEIFYDHGPAVAGGPPGSVDAEGDRYIEIWNIVFMQYNRLADKTLVPLPAPSVDTGMGLERISAVMQGVHSNYDIDLFQSLIRAAKSVLKVNTLDSAALKVIADHIRATVFLMADGVVPGNEGRSYVLRRIMRRAIRHGYQLGANEPFFYRLVSAVVEAMGEAYPALFALQSSIEEAILKEEKQFLITLSRGMALLSQDLASLNGTVIPGAIVFKLYDTYGFPIDLTADIAREKGLTIDEEGCLVLMQAQKAQSRKASDFTLKKPVHDDFFVSAVTDFTGYQALRGEGEVCALFCDDFSPTQALMDATGYILLDQTPFYAESGGQAGDQGQMQHATMQALIDNTLTVQGAHLHHAKVFGCLRVGERVLSQVDSEKRRALARHHSATHLLQAALREVLGHHVTQKGSSVDEHRLRFDFSHPAALTALEKTQVEAWVNEAIAGNHEVTTACMSYIKAKSTGALLLAGEDYEDEVRVVSMGSVSKELCGGTHVAFTGDIEAFVIKQESGVAAGVRRIEAVAGLSLTNAWLAACAQAKQAMANEQQQRVLEKQQASEQAKALMQSTAALVDKAVKVAGVAIVAECLPFATPSALRQSIDYLRDKLGSAVIVLAAIHEGKIYMIAGVTRDCQMRVPANLLVSFVAEQVGGRGGGRADMAQAGGTDVAALPAALTSVYPFIKDRL